MENYIMVSVLCTAFNHGGFIKDAIDSIISQKTDFKFELIIHDDASTDDTEKIIKDYAKKYPQTIRTIIQTENQYQNCNIYQSFLFPAVKGKYIAFCEGDDYWIDKGKLQKQVDFLESHKDYSMCMHNAIKLHCQSGKKILMDTFPQTGTYLQKEQIMAGLGSDFPAFASYMIRAELLKDIPSFFLASKVVDYPLRQYYANCGKVYYFNKPMSVYRASTPHSYMRKVSESQSFYNDYTLEMIRFFEAFNQYTLGRFEAILKRKIISDYFGFCLSIPEKEGTEKAREKKLNMEWVKECYGCLSPKYFGNSILEISRKSDHLFIYGTGRIAPICKEQLEFLGIPFDGFVVSDGQMKINKIEGKMVYYLSEVVKKFNNPGFILAMQPINAIGVAKALKRNKIRNFCEPYSIREY